MIKEKILERVFVKFLEANNSYNELINVIIRIPDHSSQANTLTSYISAMKDIEDELINYAFHWYEDDNYSFHHWGELNNEWKEAWYDLYIKELKLSKNTGISKYI